MPPPLLPQHIKINHLRLMFALAECGQLNQAAEALSITQPAASRMLAEIESLLEVKLCQRHAKGMDLTEVGQALAKRASNILIEMHNLGHEIEALKQGKEGRARVGAVTGAAIGYVVPAILRLKQSSPNADILSNVAPSEELLHDLLAGQYDFILGRIPPNYDASEFVIQAGHSESVDFVVHQSHPLCRYDTLTLHDLREYAWVMQVKGAPIREAVQETFLRSNTPLPSNIINTSSLLVMMAALESAEVIVPMAKEVFQLLAGKRIAAQLHRLPLQAEIIISPYHLITVRHRKLSPLASHLKALIEENIL